MGNGPAISLLSGINARNPHPCPSHRFSLTGPVPDFVDAPSALRLLLASLIARPKAFSADERDMMIRDKVAVRSPLRRRVVGRF